MSKEIKKSKLDNLDIILDELFSLKRFGIKPGLERILYLLGRNKNPHKKFKSIHIAGTNGKGSVSSIIASILIEAGYKVGLYTSPHLVNLNERIQINGKYIDNTDLIKLARKYLTTAEGKESTFFEITTSIAFDYFATNKVDIAVIEAGMGGRFDATNVIEPELSLITTIDLDHTEYLGTTIKAIASEKAGIIKEKVPVIVLDDNPDIRQIFIDKASELSAPIQFVDKTFGIIPKKTKHPLNRKLEINSTEEKFEVYYKLPGEHQIDNLRLALAAVESLIPEFEIRTPDIEAGIEYVLDNVRLRARCELKRKEPPIILDSAHNPNSIKALKETLLNSGYKDYRFNILFGAMKDKNIKNMIEELQPISNTFIFTTPKIDRAATINEFEKYAKESGIKYQYYNDVVDAYIYANKQNEPLIITGSFYLAGEVLKYLEY